jgi:hypothetical protein
MLQLLEVSEILGATGEPLHADERPPRDDRERSSGEIVTATPPQTA